MPLLVAWCAWWWLSFVPATPSAYFADRVPGAPALVIAHQGGDGLLPGNTLDALAHASEIGADVLEFDVQLSADGELVALHDATLERTTNGLGPVRAQPYAALARLDAGWHWPGGGDATPYRDAGFRIPRVRDIFGALPGARFNIELKEDDVQAALALCRLLGARGMGGQVLVASFRDDAMAAFRAACPAVATSATESEVRRFLVLSRLGLAGLFRSRALVLQVPRRAGGIEVLDAGFVAAARAHGLYVDVWTINTREDLREVMALGVTGVITDRPDLALAVRAPRRSAANRADELPVRAADKR